MKHKWDDEVVNEMESISSGSNAVKCDKCSFTCPDKGSLDGHMTALHYGGRDVMIPGLESIPESDCHHFSEIDSESNSSKKQFLFCTGIRYLSWL